MRNLEKQILEYLNRQNRPISTQEMYEKQLFEGITYKKLVKKMMELTLSKVVERDICDGIAYYFIEKEEAVEQINESSCTENKEMK